jgi:hypothetical protein
VRVKIEREGTLPFDDGAEAIACALQDLHPGALLMSLVHITGDASLLEGSFKPRSAGLLDAQGGLDDAERAACGQPQPKRSWPTVLAATHCHHRRRPSWSSR